MTQTTTDLQTLLLTQWKAASDKIIAIAKDIPEEKYNSQPTKDVRTFADIFRHIAFWNQYVSETAKGKQFDGSPDSLDATKYATKASLIKALSESSDEAAHALEKLPLIDQSTAELFTSFIAHTSEHYGQLVVYLRLNGIVPPGSRK